MIRILLDEHVSPSLVGKLGDKGVFAAAATHVGLSGEPDAKIWNYAFENDFVVVTGNARDFIRLLNVEVHPGLIVLREGGLTRDEQWDRIRPVIEHVLESSDENFLVNKLVEISGVASKPSVITTRSGRLIARNGYPGRNLRKGRSHGQRGGC